MLSKRIIPCLDVRDGKLTKGVKFKGNVDIGDPVETARIYYGEGADELVFYDITASNEKRSIMIDVVRRVAAEIFIPFSVGGGLRTLEDMRDVLLAGAEKVSVDSGAVRNPKLISEGSKAFGRQCVVLSMQVKKTNRQGLPSGYEVVIDGGRVYTGMDALDWSKRGQDLGAGELCVNSIDRDGTCQGFELELTRMAAEAVDVPVIASGGGGTIEHLVEAFTLGRADAAILASILHYESVSIPQLKELLAQRGIPIRL